jgi:hypothetical protein
MSLPLLSLQQLYETEHDTWLEEIIDLLKKRQLDSLDYENLIEELTALGRSEKSAVKNLLLQIIIHLLLWDFWEVEKVQNLNYWAAEIITFRVQLEDRLTTNLRKLLAENLTDIYTNARLIVMKKTQLNNLPRECPYTLTELLEKDWFPTIG